MGLFFCVAFYRDAVQLSIRAHSCFPESEMFASLSTLTPENMMDTLALIFKGKSCTRCGWKLLFLVTFNRSCIENINMFFFYVCLFCPWGCFYSCLICNVHHSAMTLKPLKWITSAFFLQCNILLVPSIHYFGKYSHLSTHHWLRNCVKNMKKPSM